MFGLACKIIAMRVPEPDEWQSAYFEPPNGRKFRKFADQLGLLTIRRLRCGIVR
jgi:hypothetical protein